MNTNHTAQFCLDDSLHHLLKLKNVFPLLQKIQRTSLKIMEPLQLRFPPSDRFFFQENLWKFLSNSSLWPLGKYEKKKWQVSLSIDVDCVADVKQGKGKAGIWTLGKALGMTLFSPRASCPPEISLPFLFERPAGYYMYTSSAAFSQVIDASTQGGIP